MLFANSSFSIKNVFAAVGFCLFVFDLYQTAFAGTAIFLEGYR